MKRTVRRELKEWLSNVERIVIAGIGNPIRMDDYVGVKVINDLRGRVSNKVLLIECETVPEIYIHQIVNFRPTHILLIDAAALGLNPGEVKLLKPEELEVYSAFSTHALPLRVFCECLIRMVNAKIMLLLVQPKLTDFGEGLTPEVLSSEREIVNFLSNVLPR
ncbi:MAG: hydrogenase 3 maturation endopeptidase HyCI [Candidatus Bathyarchaeia archaeon]